MTWRIVSPISSSGMSSVRAIGIRRAGLDHQPVAIRPHVVVIPDDLAVDDLAAARIGRARSHRVAHEARRPAHHRVARVVRIPVGILVLRRRILGDDRVLESGLLEHLLPRLDAFLHVATPLGRRRRVDVVRDRLDRLDELAARVRRGILRLETPARDERLRRGLLFVEAVVDAIHGEESDALVEDARPHRDFREQDHRLPHLERDRAAAAIARRLGGVERLHLPHFDVDRKRADAAHVAARRIEATDLILPSLRRRSIRRCRACRRRRSR